LIVKWRLLVLLLLLPACRGPAAPDDPAKDVMPSGARMVVSAKGEDPNKWERSFTIETRYPALGIRDEGFARLHGHGWKRCDSTHDVWASFPDRTRGAPAKVYRRMQYWRRNNDVLHIAYSYRVPEDVDPNAAVSAQRVELFFRGALSAEEMGRWMRAYGAPC